MFEIIGSCMRWIFEYEECFESILLNYVLALLEGNFFVNFAAAERWWQHKSLWLIAWINYFALLYYVVVSILNSVTFLSFLVECFVNTKQSKYYYCWNEKYYFFTCVSIFYYFERTHNSQVQMRKQVWFL